MDNLKVAAPVRMKKDLSKYANLLMIVLLGFIVGTGIICMDQLDWKSSVMHAHPMRVAGAYLISTLVMGALYISEGSKKK